MSFYISKIIQSFIFPPGIIILFLLFASFFVKRFRSLFITLFFISYLLSTQYIGNKLLKPLEDPYNKPLKNDPDAKLVVVLGGGYYEGSANLPLSQSAFKRAVYGYEVAKKKDLPLLYNGTKLESKNAKLTYEELFNSAIPIYYEDKALTTIDNAKLTKLFMKKHHLENKKIYLVTSAYHLNRALKEFQKVGIRAIPAGTDFRTSSKLCFCFFFPSADGMELSYLALHEYLALLKEKLYP